MFYSNRPAVTVSLGAINWHQTLSMHLAWVSEQIYHCQLWNIATDCSDSKQEHLSALWLTKGSWKHLSKSIFDKHLSSSVCFWNISHDGPFPRTGETIHHRASVVYLWVLHSQTPKGFTGLRAWKDTLPLNSPVPKSHLSTQTFSCICVSLL